MSPAPAPRWLPPPPSPWGRKVSGYGLSQRSLAQGHLCTRCARSNRNIGGAARQPDAAAGGHSERGEAMPPWSLTSMAEAGGAALKASATLHGRTIVRRKQNSSPCIPVLQILAGFAREELKLKALVVRGRISRLSLVYCFWFSHSLQKSQASCKATTVNSATS